jgi:hypothetical protein
MLLHTAVKMSFILMQLAMHVWLVKHGLSLHGAIQRGELNMSQNRYFYTYPGASVAYDIWAMDEKDARRQKRAQLHIKRLVGYQFWKA